MNRINNLAFAIFGRYIQRRENDYSAIRLAIKQAHLSLPWDIFIGTAYLYSIISGIIGAVLGYLLIPLWRFIYLNSVAILSDSGSSDMRLTGLDSYSESIFVSIAILIFPLIMGRLSYYAISAYPGMISRIRKSQLDLTLPHAVAYMYALSKGGLSLISIFKSLSQQANVYGAAAEEIGYIVMDAELRGNDLITALKNAAIRTQSEKFRDFLENLVNVASTSGDIEVFFGNTVHNYQKSAEADQGLYLEMLGMLAETYVTTYVAGPLFLITILIVMGLLGPKSLLSLKLLIYIVIPLSSILFIVLISTISLHNDTGQIEIYSISKRIRHYSDVRTTFREGDDRLIRRLMRSLRWAGILEAGKNPLRLFFSDPFKAFYITAPLAIIYFIASVYRQEITVDLLDDAIIISILILLVPFLFFYEVRSWRICAIEKSVPYFLKRLAVINDIGMPLADAIKTISKVNVGVLSTEIKLMHKDLVWSNSILNALMKFESRVRTASISRIVTLITKASESTGNIKETLRVAANYAELTEILRTQKFTILFSYLIVVYISFAVFLLVLYIFTTMFLPYVPSISTSVGSAMFSINANKEEYIRLFMHATVIQGFFSGIIAGHMMGESAYDGLKHSVIMMSTAYMLFVWFV